MGQSLFRTTPQVRTMPPLPSSRCRTAYCSTRCAKERRWRTLFRKLMASVQSPSWKKTDTCVLRTSADFWHYLVGFDEAGHDRGEKPQWRRNEKDFNVVI